MDSGCIVKAGMAKSGLKVTTNACGCAWAGETTCGNCEASAGEARGTCTFARSCGIGVRSYPSKRL
eukprot:6208457-Pleurochrysis_carterae.AAC.2